MGISASISIAFAIEGGMASYVGAAGAGAAAGAGNDATSAAANACAIFANGRPISCVWVESEAVGKYDQICDYLGSNSVSSTPLR